MMLCNFFASLIRYVSNHKLLSFVLVLSLINFILFCDSSVRWESYIISREDAMTWTMAILSLLVALLIGWNIYNALDLNKRVKHIEEENIRIINNTESALVDIQIRANDAINKLDRNRIQTEEYCMGIVDFLQGFSIIGENGNYMQAYRIFVSSILHFTKCNNKVRSNIDASLDNMEVCLNKAKQSDYNNIGNLLDFEFAVNEIIQSSSAEFTANQKERFILLENRRKSSTHENQL